MPAHSALRLRRSVAAVAAVAVALSLVAVPAGPAAAQSDGSGGSDGAGGFGDVPDGEFFAVPVAELAARGVFAGTECADGFCPSAPIDRKTMAVWTVRVLDGKDPAPITDSRFDDVDAAGFHAPYIERMAELEVTEGCGNGAFCPDRTVTRDQMAVFISRAYDLPDGPDPGFDDVGAGEWYSTYVAKLAASRITAGCASDPPRYCPGRDTTRGEMATFLHRAENREPGAAPTYKAVDSGRQHACAIRNDNTVTCWGHDSLGETDAPDGEYTAVSAGQWHTCAIRTDNTIACWGHNWQGKADAPDGEYTAVSAGGEHSCAIRTDRNIACWGDNGAGQTDAPDGEYTAVSAGQWHTCAIRADRNIACWGDNGADQTDAPDGEYTAVSAGQWHTCAIRADRTATCWGADQWGLIDAPVGEFTAVSASQAHTCGIRTDRTVACWGSDNEHGQTDAPDGEYTSIATGSEHSCGLSIEGAIACWGSIGHDFTAEPAGTFAKIAAGQDHTCAIRTDHTVACWGNNSSGRTAAPDGSFIALSAGYGHSCGLRADGAVECWGDNEHGQTDAPDGSFTDIAAGESHTCAIRTDRTATCWGHIWLGQAAAPAGEYTDITAGEDHTCAIRTDRTIACWGNNSSGRATAPDGEFVTVTAGQAHTCGIRTDNTVACWGDNWANRATAPDGEFVTVTAGQAHTCGIRTDNTVECWGNNWSGQTNAPDGSFTDIAAGSEHSCAVSAEGAAECWGIETVARPAGVQRFVHPRGPEPGACRPYGIDNTTAGFPLPGFALTSTGTLKVVVLFVDFPDAAATHSTHDEARSLERAERYLESLSYGRLDVEFDPLHRWLRAPEDYEAYQADGFLGTSIENLINDVASELADPYVDFSEYDLMVVVMPSTHFGGGNAIGTALSEEGPITTSRVNTTRYSLDWDPPVQDWSDTAAHEMLHNLGLLDLYSYDDSVYELPDAPSGQVWASANFGVMGLQAFFLASGQDPLQAYAAEMLAWHRWQLGWLDADQIRCISGAQATVDLRAVAAPGNGKAMAAIPLSASELIVIESRRKINHDQPQLLEEGVLVYTVDASVRTGHLPMRVAGDSGNGQVDGYPILRTGESVTVQGFTIRVASDDGHTHTVEIARQS